MDVFEELLSIFETTVGATGRSATAYYASSLSIEFPTVLIALNLNLYRPPEVIESAETVRV
jgi:hypothetical protein